MASYLDFCKKNKNWSFLEDKKIEKRKGQKAKDVLAQLLHGHGRLDKSRLEEDRLEFGFVHNIWSESVPVGPVVCVQDDLLAVLLLDLQQPCPLQVLSKPLG